MTERETVIHYVTRDGRQVSPDFTIENDAHKWLLRHQPMSNDWALKYEGYSFEQRTEGTTHTMIMLARQASGYRGSIFTDDQPDDGTIRIQFPTTHHAATFVDTMIRPDPEFDKIMGFETRIITAARPAEPITDLFAPVTLIVTPVSRDAQS